MDFTQTRAARWLWWGVMGTLGIAAVLRIITFIFPV